MMKMSQIVLFIMLSISATGACVGAEQQGYSKRSEQLLQALKEQIKSTLAEVSVAEQHAGHDPHNFSYQMAIPAQKQYKLGLVVDARHLNDGLKVVSVDPGGAAEQAGININDRIVAVDGIKIAHLKNNSQLSILLHPRTDDQLLIGFESAGKYRETTLKLPSVYVPNVNLNIEKSTVNAGSGRQTCGRLDIGNFSYQKHVFSAILRRINDAPVKYKRSTINLSPGLNTITVTQGDVNSGSQKSIDIDVQPGIKYYVGIYLLSRREGDWVPVVWNTQKTECSNN